MYWCIFFSFFNLDCFPLFINFKLLSLSSHVFFPKQATWFKTLILSLERRHHSLRSLISYPQVPHRRRTSYLDIVKLLFHPKPITITGSPSHLHEDECWSLVVVYLGWEIAVEENDNFLGVRFRILNRDVLVVRRDRNDISSSWNFFGLGK